MSRNEIESEVQAKRRAQIRGYVFEGLLGAALLVFVATQIIH